MNYFAVQSRSIESDLEMTELVVRAAHDLGLKFTKIEALDRFKLGGTEFMRFRLKADIAALLDKIHSAGRPVIGPDVGGFTARIKGRTGVAPAATMLAMPRKVVAYRGPGAQHWERQFEGPN